jgi:hypothetical protein
VPKGVEVVVENGFATIDFTDVSLRGPALQRLLEIGGPETIETLTREGPRRKYRVPVGNVTEAGLLDKRSKVKALASGDSGFSEALRVAGLDVGVRAGARP